MSTSREIALESAVRFTERGKNTVKDMLRNAEAIEEWLNRGFKADGFNKNPLTGVAEGYHRFGKDNGTLPNKVYLHSELMNRILLYLGEEPPFPISYKFIGLTATVDNSLNPDELKFAFE